MARKTIKGLEVIITDLEKRLNEQNKINVELHNQISQMQMIADDKFENSPIYHQMVKEIEQLKTVIRLNEINTKSKDDTIKRDRDTIQKLLKEIEELKSNNCVNKLKNERGAGRKEMFNEEQKGKGSGHFPLPHQPSHKQKEEHYSYVYYNHPAPHRARLRHLRCGSCGSIPPQGFPPRRCLGCRALAGRLGVRSVRDRKSVV